MFCPNCKNQIAPGTSICPTCGANIEQIVQPVTPAVSAEQPVAPVQTNHPVQSQPEITSPVGENSNTTIESSAPVAPVPVAETPVTEQPVAPAPAVEAPVVETPVAQPAAPVISIQRPIEKSSKNGIKWVIIIIVALVVIALIVFGVSKLFNKPEQNTPQELPTSEPINNVEPINDANVPSSDAFLMYVEDVFSITGRGTIVTGRIKRGTVSLDDNVQIVGLDNKVVDSVVTGIEVFRKQLDTASEGENVGLLLRGVSRDQVERGQVISKPNSIGSYKKIDAQIDTLTSEAGGRHTPFYSGYNPQVYIGTANISGVVTLPAGVETVNPGDSLTVTIELEKSVALEIGTEIAIREGGRTVAKGKITKIY